MAVTVVDASAVAAVLFDEPEAEPVLASLDGALLAPNLLVYELASVCTTKLVRHSADAQTILARYMLFAELEIELSEPHWQTLPHLANQWSLSAHDAAYLQLALLYRVPLVTLDSRLARAYDQATA